MVDNVIPFGGPPDVEKRLRELPPAEIGSLLAALGGDAGPFTPLPGPQTAALNREADELLYGGSAGGGKSLLLGAAATRHRRSLILRRQSTELDGLIADLVGMLGSEGFNKNDHEHTVGGRSIKLGGCREADDWRQYAGRARDLMGFDEAGEFLEEQVSSLLAWLRSTDPQQRCRAIFASNPPQGAEGQWLVRWLEPWLDPTFPIRRCLANCGGSSGSGAKRAGSRDRGVTRLTTRPTRRAAERSSRHGSATTRS